MKHDEKNEAASELTGQELVFVTGGVSDVCPVTGADHQWEKFAVGEPKYTRVDGKVVPVYRYKYRCTHCGAVKDA